MKTKNLLIFALFLMLTGFNGEDRIVEQSGVNLQASVDDFGPSPISKPRVYASNQGSDVILEMRFKARPKAEVIWYHGPDVVREGNRYEMILNTKSSDEYTAILIIRELEMGDAGKYKVNVKNKLGEFNGIITLDITPV